MVKARKLECCPMKERGNAKFPILSPGQSQSEEKKRLQLRHLGFDIVNSLGTTGNRYSFYLSIVMHCSGCSG